MNNVRVKSHGFMETSFCKVSYGWRSMTSQSTTFGINNSSLAIDGDISTCSIVKHQIKSKRNPWWRVQLARTYDITNVAVLFVHNSTYADFMNNLVVHVSMSNSTGEHLCSSSTTNRIEGHFNIVCKTLARGDVVTIKRIGGMFRMFLILCEVQIYSNLDSVNLALNMPTSQSGILFADTGRLAVDGDLETCAKVGVEEGKFARWTVALGETFHVAHVIVYFRTEQPEIIDFNYFKVYISIDDDNLEEHLCATFVQPSPDDLERKFVNFTCKENILGKQITLKKYRGIRPHWLMFCEVELYANRPADDCPKGEVMCEILSVCIPKKFVCDRQRHCPDGSDELHCGCLKHEYRCHKGQCIHNDWLCDRTKDCPHGDDETMNCKYCSSREFKCRKFNLCIDMLKRCDGFQDCPDFSDEDKCLNPEGNFLMATFKGESGFQVCSKNWDYRYSFYICQGLLDRFVVDTFYLKTTERNPKIVVLKLPRPKDLLPEMEFFEKSATCVSGEFVKIACQPTKAMENTLCGKRGIPDNLLGPYIINGDKALRGAWPWHVQLSGGKYKCGGSIINENWILTAAHCVRVMREYRVLARFGTAISMDSWSPSREISHMVVHPVYNNTHKFDIAMMRTGEPIEFNDIVRPICLPTGVMDYRSLFSFRYCVFTGFGHVDRNKTAARFLTQGRMNLLKNDECSKDISVAIKETKKACEAILKECRLICAGSVPLKDGITACKGDSGGPLVCKRDGGLWTQIGVLAGHMYGRDKEMCLNSLFGRIDLSLDFISSVLKEEQLTNSEGRNWNEDQAYKLSLSSITGLILFRKF